MPTPLGPRPGSIQVLPPGFTIKPIRRQPLWRGPLIDGITYSLLCKFLQCPERFRLQVIEGLREPEGWSHYTEYGSLFHTAEEARVAGKPWQAPLLAYYKTLLEKYPANHTDITKWYLLCKMQFPIYVRHWQNHETERGRRPIYSEKPFIIDYQLPDGRRLKLRGKIDSAYSRDSYAWLQENKTKGDIDAEAISTTVNQNLQTMLYHNALRILLDTEHPKQEYKIAGTVYNVIRRPLSERSPLRQRKTESQDAFFDRVAKTMTENVNKHFFRWTVPILPTDIARFKRECLHPILSRLLDWWDGFKGDPFSPEKNPHHYRYPFGAYHALERGYRGDYFRLLTTGSKAGLQKTTNLFPEL